MNRKCKSCGEQLNDCTDYSWSDFGGTPCFTPYPERSQKSLHWRISCKLNVEDADLCEFCCVDMFQRSLTTRKHKLLRTRDACLAAMRGG